MFEPVGDEQEDGLADGCGNTFGCWAKAGADADFVGIERAQRRWDERWRVPQEPGAQRIFVELGVKKRVADGLAVAVMRTDIEHLADGMDWEFERRAVDETINKDRPILIDERETKRCLNVQARCDDERVDHKIFSVVVDAKMSFDLSECDGFDLRRCGEDRRHGKLAKGRKGARAAATRGDGRVAAARASLFGARAKGTEARGRSGPTAVRQARLERG
jgi:hypothetical protein